MQRNTSITVGRLTLAYVNRLRGFLDYLTGKRINLNATVLTLAVLCDYLLQKQFGSWRIDETVETFAERRLNELAKEVGIEGPASKIILDQIGLQKLLEKM